MPTPTTYPSAKQFLSLAKETTQGTPVTPGTVTDPITKFQPKDDPTWLEDRALRGSMGGLYGLIQGVRKSTFDANGAVFLSGGFPHYLLNIMGEVATTGPVSSIYTHAVTLLNSGTGQPPSHTFIDWQGLTATTKARTYAGSCFSELTIKGNPASSLLEWSGKGTGFWSAAYPTSEPTIVGLPTIGPSAAWRMELGVGGVLPGAKNLTISEWEITISRKLSVEHTSQNSQDPFIIQRGELDVGGKFRVLKPSDETFLNYMRNNTQPQMQFLLANGAAGASAQTFQVDVQAAAHDTAEINRGEEAVGYDVTWRAIHNTINVGASGGFGPAKFTVTNAVASY